MLANVVIGDAVAPGSVIINIPGIIICIDAKP